MTHQHHKNIVSVVLALAALTACGSSEETTPSTQARSSSPTTVTAIETTDAAADTTERPPTASSETSSPVSASATTARWRDDVEAACDEFITGLDSLPEDDGTAADIAAFIEAFREMAAGVPRVQDIEAPAEQQAAIADLDAIVTEADGWLAAAAEAAAAGDDATARTALDRAFSGYGLIGGTLAIAGARCGDAEPARAAAAALNVPVQFGPWQIAAGFGSIWVSEMHGARVVRLDPETGDVIATIDVGEQPFKLQPADDRIWVRLESRYIAIDPASDAIVAELAKADVGPEANRSWALDSAMWICDGRHLHRYDPTTLEAVAVIDLAVDCGQVYATDELVVAWSYNEDDGESGNSAAAFVNPATNQVFATVDLPVDVGVPVVLDNAVFFAGWGGSKGVVVDRASWTVTDTPDLGAVTKGSLIVTDGSSIFVPTDCCPKDVLVVDAATFEVTASIEPLGNNALAVLDGSLWTADLDFGLVQRFDVS